MIEEELYKQLKIAVGNIGERIEQKGSFKKLAVTNLSEVLKNNEVAVEMILKGNMPEKAFNVLFLVKEEELLKMRKKKWFFFRSNVTPEVLLKIIIDDQNRILCTVYNSMVPKGAVNPEGAVKEELKKFVRLHKEIEEFVIT